MANEQQATPSMASDTATPNEENIEDQREREKKEALQIIFSELKNDFETRVREGASFSIKFDYDPDLSTSKNGNYENIEGWEITFNFTESDLDNANECRINFEVTSTPIGDNSEPTPVSQKDKGYIAFVVSGNSISTNFYYKKGLFKILEINDELEIPQKELSLKPYKQVNPEILEVWFPPKSGSMSLQCPIKLSDENDDWIGAESRHWLEIGERLVVESPTMRVEDGKVVSDFDKWWSVVRSIISYWTVAAVYSEEERIGSFLADVDGVESNTDKKQKSEDYWDLPPRRLFEPVRPVNLHPNDVLSGLKGRGLHFPWHVIESACAALNAGKNVIFTGPPGCGKSKLASFLAREATQEPPLMATASPAWTSGDLIGRYMPARNGKGLVFREGFLLRAVPQNSRPKWLIIDEFNRADIDSCFGELFSLLAGDAVELPFEKLIESEEDQSEVEEMQSTSFVRIVPASTDDVEEQAGDYRVPRRFRLIGTMNDADRSGLNNLSFALMRRFAFIPVEAPDNKTIEKKIIEKKLSKTSSQLKLEQFSWQVRKSEERRSRGKSSLLDIEPEVKALFASSDSDFGNLVSSRTVGVSSIGDVLRFVGEGLRSSGKKEREVDYRHLQDEDGILLPKSSGETVDRDKVAEMLSLSYLALALVLEVFPQLESLEQGAYSEENKLLKAIKHIFTSIHKGGNDKSRTLHMIRIAKNDDDQDKYEDRILESDRTIAEFLFENLKTRLPNLDASRLRSELVKEDWLSEEA